MCVRVRACVYFYFDSTLILEKSIIHNQIE